MSLIKLIYLLKQRPDISYDYFKHHWTTMHASILREVAPTLGIVFYSQSLTLNNANDVPAMQFRGPQEKFEGVAELWFDTKKAEGNEQQQLQASERLNTDEKKFINIELSHLWLGVENVIFNKTNKSHSNSWPDTQVIVNSIEETKRRSQKNNVDTVNPDLLETNNNKKMSFEKQLKHYQQLSIERLLSSLPTSEPQHHLYKIIQENISSAGKGLRPALCIATCLAFGGRIEDVLQSAAAIEMLHNAFLVHDDIEDESDFRHGQSTLHQRYGVAIAINTGDAMNAQAMTMLNDNLILLGASLTSRILTEFQYVLTKTLEGQAMELGWVKDNSMNIGVADYFEMICKKTSWYSFILPCRIGALIANRKNNFIASKPLGTWPAEDSKKSDDKEFYNKFIRFGYLLGTAFQIHDDWLNLSGDQARYGKEIYGDLLEGKRTLMLINLLDTLQGDEALRLKTFLSQPRSHRNSDDVPWVHKKMTDLGSLNDTATLATTLMDTAQISFEDAFASAPESEHKQFIRNFISYVVARTL